MLIALIRARGSAVKLTSPRIIRIGNQGASGLVLIFTNISSQGQEKKRGLGASFLYIQRCLAAVIYLKSLFAKCALIQLSAAAICCGATPPLATRFPNVDSSDNIG